MFKFLSLEKQYFKQTLKQITTNTLFMKYLSILLVILLLISCQPSESAPTDLAGKKELLKKKKTELGALKLSVQKLEQEIAELDTTKTEKSRRLVTTIPVERKDFKRHVEIQSSVQSDDIVMASSETGGRLLSMPLKEGQNVRRGQLVATLDLESINKQIAELETTLQLAADVFDRQKRLWDQNIGSEMQFLKAKNDKERIEKSLETLRFQQTKSSVYAPISGVVDMVMLKAGEMSAPGSPIVQILNTKRVKVIADVPETYLGKVKRGDLVTIKFPALDQETNGKVSLIGRTINPNNRTFAVEVNMSNPKGVLKPNLLALMLINDYSKKEAITIPLEVIQQEVDGKDYVYIKSEGKEGPIAQKVYVETGEGNDGEIIIESGLKGGEALIMEGARGLAENELIKVQTATPPVED